MQTTAAPIRVMRLIARLNVGGPAIQAITLTQGMRPLGYETQLVRGVEEPLEGSMDRLAAALGVHPARIKWLQRRPGVHDFRALGAIWRLMRGFRPDIVHTHAAKAGTLGRLAALLSRSRPVTVHTFHGHVLEGYFSKRQASLFRAIERWLAKRTSRLIAVSEEVRDDLVRLGIAPHERISVVPLGFELDRFLLREPERGRRRVAFRAQVGIAESTALVTLVARLVPIKRVDRFLRIARLLSQQSEAEFLIVGDGELRDQLLSDADARALGPRLRWHGFTERIEDVYFASDVVVLTSDNEGTPVSLIEAGAAALPVVSTDVGGVRTVVGDGVSGFVVAREDDRGFAGAVAQLLASPALARAFGAAGRAHVTSTFTLERLVADLDHVYRGLLLRSAA